MSCQSKDRLRWTVFLQNCYNVLWEVLITDEADTIITIPAMATTVYGGSTNGQILGIFTQAPSPSLLCPLSGRPGHSVRTGQVPEPGVVQLMSAPCPRVQTPWGRVGLWRGLRARASRSGRTG